MTPEEAYYKCRVISNYRRNKYLEQHIINDPEYAYRYAREVIKGRWIEAEEIIKNNTKNAYLYAIFIIENRWKKAEEFIKKDPQYAYLYAKYVIKDRWKQAEIYIIKSPMCSYMYALDVIKGKLPENMHNAMLLRATTDDEWARDYFNFIK